MRKMSQDLAVLEATKDQLHAALSTTRVHSEESVRAEKARRAVLARRVITRMLQGQLRLPFLRMHAAVTASREHRHRREVARAVVIRIRRAELWHALDQWGWAAQQSREERLSLDKLAALTEHVGGLHGKLEEQRAAGARLEEVLRERGEVEAAHAEVVGTLEESHAALASSKAALEVAHVDALGRERERRLEVARQVVGRMAHSELAHFFDAWHVGVEKEREAREVEGEEAGREQELEELRGEMAGHLEKLEINVHMAQESVAALELERARATALEVSRTELAASMAVRDEVVADAQFRVRERRLEVARRLVRRMTHGEMAACFEQWLVEMAQGKAARQHVVKLSAFVDEASELRGKLEAQEELASESGLQMSTLEASLEQLEAAQADLALVGYEMRNAQRERGLLLALRVVAKVQHAELSRGFDRWAVEAARGKEARLRVAEVVRRAVGRISHSGVRNVFDAWSLGAQKEVEARRRLEVGRCVVVRMRHGEMAGCFDAWASAVEKRGELAREEEERGQSTLEVERMQRRVQELEELCAALETAHAEALRCQEADGIEKEAELAGHVAVLQGEVNQHEETLGAHRQYLHEARAEKAAVEEHL
ncbi:hypothetical protein T484DRAFT_1800497, partial [Baffinella frigidus]